jgi:hypothetical protein
VVGTKSHRPGRAMHAALSIPDLSQKLLQKRNTEHSYRLSLSLSSPPHGSQEGG